MLFLGELFFFASSFLFVELPPNYVYNCTIVFGSSFEADLEGLAFKLDLRSGSRGDLNGSY